MGSAGNAALSLLFPSSLSAPPSLSLCLPLSRFFFFFAFPPLLVSLSLCARVCVSLSLSNSLPLCLSIALSCTALHVGAQTVRTSFLRRGHTARRPTFRMAPRSKTPLKSWYRTPWCNTTWPTQKRSLRHPAPAPAVLSLLSKGTVCLRLCLCLCLGFLLPGRGWREREGLASAVHGCERWAWVCGGAMRGGGGGLALAGGRARAHLRAAGQARQVPDVQRAPPGHDTGPASLHLRSDGALRIFPYASLLGCPAACLDRRCVRPRGLVAPLFLPGGA